MTIIAGVVLNQKGSCDLFTSGSHRAALKVGATKSAASTCKPGERMRRVLLFFFFSGNCECLSATKTSSGVCGHNPMWHGQSRGRDWRARRKRQRMATLNESEREVGRQTGKESVIFSPVPLFLQEHTRVKLMLPFLFPTERPIKRCSQMKATDQNSLNWLSSFAPLSSHHLNFQRQLAEH